MTKKRRPRAVATLLRGLGPTRPKAEQLPLRLVAKVKRRPVDVFYLR